MMLKFVNQFSTIRVTRKAKIYKKPLYEAIPDFHRPHFIDIHDTYQYRKKQEVMQELSQAKISVEITRHLYPPNDIGREIKQRKAIIEFDINQFNFTELQMERFKVLMGSRYKQGNNQIKMVCEMFPQFDQNFDKLIEQFREVIMQSKRAP